MPRGRMARARTAPASNVGGGKTDRGGAERRGAMTDNASRALFQAPRAHPDARWSVTARLESLPGDLGRGGWLAGKTPRGNGTVAGGAPARRILASTRVGRANRTMSPTATTDGPRTHPHCSHVSMRARPGLRLPPPAAMSSSNKFGEPDGNKRSTRTQWSRSPPAARRPTRIAATSGCREQCAARSRRIELRHERTIENLARWGIHPGAIQF